MIIEDQAPGSLRTRQRAHQLRLANASAAVLGELPALATVVVARPRVEHTIADAFTRAGVVEIIAGSGCGKTTAAALHAETRPGPVTWLTLPPGFTADELGRALESCLPAPGIPGATPPLVVIDNAEIAEGDPATATVLAGFLRRATAVDVLILTTRHLGSTTGDLVLRGLCEVVMAEQLRLTTDDAAALIERLRPAEPIGADAVVAQSGGWIAGGVLLIRFGGAGGSAQSPVLVAYVESQIVDTLPLDEQDLLLAGALLDRITRPDSAGLLGTHGESVFFALRGRGLPMITAADDTLVYSPLLRRCLREILPRRRSQRMADIRRRFAFHLAVAGRFDQVVDWCVAAEEPLLAVEALEYGVRSLGDPAAVTDRVERWSELIGESRLLTSDLLTACVLRALHARRGFDRAVPLIHQLEADDRMDDIVAADPGIVGVVLWTLHSRPIEAEHYVRDHRDDHAADAVRFMLAATSGTEPALPPLATSWGNLAKVVHWGMLWQGRCDDIVAALDGPDAEDNPNVALAAAWNDRIDLAEQAFERIVPTGRDRPHAVFVRAALDIARGRHDEARQQLRAHALEARRTGAESTYEILTAWATLQAGAPEEATALRYGSIEMNGGERRAISEWARLVLGVALLELDQPGDAAVVLTPAVESMRRARRQLMLSAASYALAEAHLRLGAESTAAAVLADLRRSGIRRRGYWTTETLTRCHHLRAARLLEPVTPALSEEPAEQLPERIPAVTAVQDRQPAVVEFLPFHEPPLIVVDGMETSGRRTKVVELIADLAQHPDGVERSRLQERLFPEVERSKGGNHFRQIVFRLRELTGVRLERRNPAVVAWPESVKLVALDRQFEQEVLRARTVAEPTEAHLRQLRDALDLAPGIYLPGSDLAWVEERRTYLSVLFEEAVTTLLWWAVEAGDVELVRGYGARVLEFNPFSEEIYGLLIRAEHLAGNRAAAMAIFQRAHSALGELGLEPGAELRRLVQLPPAAVNARATRGPASR
ncbi:bacterial transcriptional activator domain-containing protein [Nocardia sp. alder85J]|uniref:bacterial transcriptional activator domain-containing protein n=1 Tax=Nocardia sp. alder85J TaxID=2862949 RepID=UPI001CD3ED43|nr:bacterial transcriptional activator domain-containing protein [Nocardia sp. alder85J]MCX4092370.1 bacterial transcriptional activator domain-containing protein [Nocardia sp. alder85J]